MRTPLLLAVTGLVFMAPLVAHAEESDPGDVAHAIFIVGMIGLLFLCSLSFGIWLLIARLRSDGKASSSALKPVSPDFERIWFPNRSSESLQSGPRS